MIRAALTPAQAEQLVDAHAAWQRRTAVQPTDEEYRLLQDQHERALGRDERHDGEARGGCWCCCTDCPDDIPPWTEDQVDSLVRRQKTGHPYTCGGEHDGRPPLTPTTRGWVCPDPTCDYRQVWAYSGDLNGGLSR